MFFQSIFLHKGKFKILEHCAVDDLIKREKHYIDSLKPYMNHILDPIKIKRDDIYRKRLSESLKKSFENGREVVNKQPIHMYSLQGLYIKSFESITDAADYFNTSASGICAVINGRAYSAQKHLWSVIKQDSLDIPTKNYKLQKVIQLSTNEEIIKIWDSIKSAQKELKISNISRAAKHNRTAGGFKWRFEQN